MPVITRGRQGRPAVGRSPGNQVPADPPPSGRARAINLAIIVLVVLAVGGAALLLARTVSVANRIDAKAQNIATSGRGINLSTDSIIQLSRTNELAKSILSSARPLDDQLTSIVSRARSIRGFASSIDGKVTGINGTAGQINSSARTINGTAGAISGSADDIQSVAGTINGTARGINSRAGAIVAVARLIDRDAKNINQNLDSTIGLANAIKVDTGNILGQARAAKDTAACIDKKLEGGGGDTSDCKGS